MRPSNHSFRRPHSFRFLGNILAGNNMALSVNVHLSMPQLRTCVGQVDPTRARNLEEWRYTVLQLHTSAGQYRSRGSRLKPYDTDAHFDILPIFWLRGGRSQRGTMRMPKLAKDADSFSILKIIARAEPSDSRKENQGRGGDINEHVACNQRDSHYLE